MYRSIIKTFRILLVLSLGLASCVSNKEQQVSAPLQVIFDTDLGNDIDDLLALQMLINYEQANKLDIKGISVSKANPLAMLFTKTFYNKYGKGRPEFGYVYDGPNPGEGNFLRNAYASLAGSADSVEVNDQESYVMMRKLLTQSADASMNIIAVGPMTNLARLLSSKADSISPLTGMELVKQKVKRLDFMGGNFSSIHEPEWNLLQDSTAARFVLESWPTLMVASGFETGNKVKFHADDVTRGFDQRHPLRVGYENFLKMPYNRPCWDLIPIVNLVEPTNGFLHESENGFITFDSACCTRFTVDDNGRCRFVTLTADGLEDLISKRITNKD